MSKKNIVIAGGGTGGHIYPGIALADKLKTLYPDYQVHFVGAVGGLEEKIVPKHDYPLHLLPVGRLHHSVGLFRRLKALLLLPWSFIKALLLYISLRPRWVLGVGGFASAPFVFVSSIFGGRTALLEPNAFPGMANRKLSKFVSRCFIVFKEAEKFFPQHKVKTVGLPVRFPKTGMNQFYENTRPLNVLIFGGSQGARAINTVIGDWVENMADLKEKVRIVHQVGARDFSIWQQRYADKHKDFLEYADYIHDMPKRLEWADIVICRAGVGTVAEVAMSCTPAVFIPLPTAADNHQQKNAEVLVNRQASLMFLQKDFHWSLLNETVKGLVNDTEPLAHMKKELSKIDYSDAPVQIIESLMEGIN